MKKTLLFLLIISSVSANAQTQKPSLKDLLYSGKLKSDSNSVVRSSDDLSSKIDTSTKKSTEPAVTKATASADSSVKKTNTVIDSATGVATEVQDSATTAAAPVKETTAPVKSNTKIWKEYADSLVSVLKTEVLSSKKIKKESYYMMVDYEIGADGQVSITNVSATPENSLLQEQVKERILSAPPQLASALDSNGNPRKVKRKYSFTIIKE